MKYSVSETDLQTINELEPLIPIHRLLRRTQCLRLKYHGLRNKKIAEILEVRPETISVWLKKHAVGGIYELLEWNYLGRKSTLSRANLEEIQEAHQENPFTTAKDLQIYLKNHFGLEYHLHWVQKLAREKLDIDFREEQRKERERFEIGLKFMKAWNRENLGV